VRKKGGQSIALRFFKFIPTPVFKKGFIQTTLFPYFAQTILSLPVCASGI
jgi:hypothetical protein